MLCEKFYVGYVSFVVIELFATDYFSTNKSGLFIQFLSLIGRKEVV